MLDYFGFREDPFGVTPDPSFLFESLGHRQAFASILSGIEAGRGFMALIADPGMGKTTLLFKLLEHLQPTARTVFLFQTQCSSREFLAYLLADLEIDHSDKDFVQMHLRLNEALAREAEAGRRCVVVIDEAQNLDASVLETVRLLSNFETTRSKLLQIVLAGQPALADRLSEEGLKQLRQRLSLVSKLEPMKPSEVGEYIAHRLRVAGYSGAPLFDAGAELAIAEHSGGIPRSINNFCFNALSICHRERRKQANLQVVQQVVSELELRPSFGEVGTRFAKDEIRNKAENRPCGATAARASPELLPNQFAINPAGSTVVPPCLKDQWPAGAGLSPRGQDAAAVPAEAGIASPPPTVAIPPVMSAAVPVETLPSKAPRTVEVAKPPAVRVASQAGSAQTLRRNLDLYQDYSTVAALPARPTTAAPVRSTRAAREERFSRAQRLGELLERPAETAPIFADLDKKKGGYGWLVAVGIILALSAFLGNALGRIGSGASLWHPATNTRLPAEVTTYLLQDQVAHALQCAQIVAVGLIVVLIVYSRWRAHRRRN